MFLANVLVGKPTVGKEDMPRPPPIDPEVPYELYDATVDQLPKPTIYVIYDNTQCYPQFLIEYVTVASPEKKASKTGVIKRTPVRPKVEGGKEEIESKAEQGGGDGVKEKTPEKKALKTGYHTRPC